MVPPNKKNIYILLKTLKIPTKIIENVNGVYTAIKHVQSARVHEQRRNKTNPLKNGSFKQGAKLKRQLLTCESYFVGF